MLNISHNNGGLRGEYCIQFPNGVWKLKLLILECAKGRAVSPAGRLENELDLVVGSLPFLSVLCMLWTVWLLSSGAPLV